MQIRFQTVFLTLFISIFMPLQSAFAWEIEENSNEILRNIIIETENKLVENEYDYSSNQLNGLDAWIDDSELKWSNSELGNFDRQKLSFELKLKNKEQIRAEQNILDMGQSKVALTLNNLLEKRLKTTYLSLIDYIEQKKRRILLQQQKTLTNTELNSWKIKVNSTDFRADKLQQAAITLDNIWAEELDNNAAIRRYKNQRNQSQIIAINYNREQNAYHLISIQQMIDMAQQIIQTKAYQQQNPQIRKAELGVLLANKKKQRFNAQEKFSLNAVKLEYDKKDDNLGISIGIKMPITKNSYDSLLQAQQQQYASLDAENLVVEISDQLNEKLFQLQRMQDQWLSNQQLIHKINARIHRLSHTNNFTLLHDLKQEQLKNRIQQNKIQMSALRIYINFLNTAGMLSAKPYRNWIQTGTPEIL